MAAADSNVQNLIGDCGRFQVILTTAVHSASVMSAWGMMYMAFAIYNPGWACLDDDNNNVTLLDLVASNNTSVSSLTSSVTMGKRNETIWSVNCEIKKRCKNLMYNPESSTMVTEWDLTCDNKAWIPSLIISILMTGVLIGAYANGHMGDRFGRKVSLYSCVVFVFAGQLSAYFQVTWEFYAISAFIIGFGNGGILTCSFPYPLEFLTERWRGILSAFPIWNVGSITFAVTIFIVKDWRSVHILSAVFSTIVFLPVFWTPESVRWLVVREKVNKSKTIVAQIARMNGRPCPDTTIIDDIANEEKTKMSNYKYTYLDLFKARVLRSYSIKFGLIWITMAVSYYSISFAIKSLSGNFYLNFLLFAVFEFPGTISFVPIVNRIGRRNSCLLYYSLASAASLGVAIVSLTVTESYKDVLILAFALLCKMIILGAWSLVGLLSAELYPTVVRNLHSGYLNSVARIGSIFSPYLIPNSPETLYVPYLVIGALYVLVVGMIWTLPDTKGRTLADRTQDEPQGPELNALNDDPA